MSEKVFCDKCKDRFTDWISEVDSFVFLGFTHGMKFSNRHGKIKYCPFCATKLRWLE